MAELNHNTSNFKNDLNEQAKLFNKKPEVVENNYYTGIVLNKIIGLTNKITIGGGRILEEVYGIKTNDKSIRIGTLGGMPKGKRVALIVLLEKWATKEMNWVWDAEEWDLSVHINIWYSSVILGRRENIRIKIADVVSNPGTGNGDEIEEENKIVLKTALAENYGLEDTELGNVVVQNVTEICADEYSELADKYQALHNLKDSKVSPDSPDKIDMAKKIMDSVETINEIESSGQVNTNQLNKDLKVVREHVDTYQDDYQMPPKDVSTNHVYQETKEFPKEVKQMFNNQNALENWVSVNNNLEKTNSFNSTKIIMSSPIVEEIQSGFADFAKKGCTELIEKTTLYDKEVKNKMLY